MNWILDVLLIVVLLAVLAYGVRKGLVRSIGAIAGAIGGAVLAFFIVPYVGAHVPGADWRALATLVVAALLVGCGYLVGSRIGDAVARRFTLAPVRYVDRLLGGAVDVVAAALVLSLLSASVLPLGIPVLSQAIAGSNVLRTIDGATPDPVQAALARIRSFAVSDTIPSVVEAFGGITASPDLPSFDTASGDLGTAAASVVRITGNAWECGQSQSGSGFVVATDRIVTNAHVVAGVTEPVIEAPNGQATAGRIVYFDPIDDLAVIAVSGLDVAPLELAGDLASNDEAVVDGYPFGGPFTSGPARVITARDESVADIYGESSSDRDVYTLAANVQQGNSGGPLLTLDGEVAGVVFARSATTENIGFAMTNTELAPVVERAALATSPVDSGRCTAS